MANPVVIPGPGTPVASGNLLHWGATGTPTSLGQLGMDVGNGRPQIYVDGAAKSVAHTGDAGLVSRYATDSNDLTLWEASETVGSTIANSGTASSADLSLGGAASLGNIGIFSYAAGSTGAQTCIWSGASGVEPAYPVTLSIWFLPVSLGGGGTYHLMVKPWNSGSWTNPFAKGIAMGINSDLTMFVSITKSAAYTSYNSVAPYKIRPHEWNFAQVEYDGANLKGYLNGNLVITQANSGALDYGSNTVNWMVGGNTTTSGLTSEGFWCDARIASVARGLTWHRAVWAASGRR